MGQIDVSDILADPELVDALTIIRRTPTVNNFGQNILSERSEPTFGCVQPASGKTLQRLPEALRIANVSSFWVKGQIISDGSCQYPDVILYQGSRYTVQIIFDYTNWGDGWCEGTCVREKPSLG